MFLNRPQQLLRGLFKFKTWSGLLHDRRAVTSIEYGMIALIIILGIVLGANKIGNQLSGTFNNVSSEL